MYISTIILFALNLLLVTITFTQWLISYYYLYKGNQIWSRPRSRRILKAVNQKNKPTEAIRSGYFYAFLILITRLSSDEWIPSRTPTKPPKPDFPPFTFFSPVIVRRFSKVRTLAEASHFAPLSNRQTTSWLFSQIFCYTVTTCFNHPFLFQWSDEFLVLKTMPLARMVKLFMK